VQDGARRIVGTRHVLETNAGGLGANETSGVWRVGHFALFFQQREHAVQVGQALLDLAVQHAQKIQRDVELDHEGIDHDQIAQGHAAIDDPLGGAPQHGHQGYADDQLLACVEQTQGGLRFQSGFAQALQSFVVTV